MLPVLPSLDPLILIGSNTSRASIITWDGEAGDSLWSNPLNWDADRLPQADEVAMFGDEWITDDVELETGVEQPTQDVKIDVDVTVGGIEISDGFVGTIGTDAIELVIGSHGFRQDYGRFISRTSRFDLNGSLTLTDGIFIAPESTMNISGHLNITTDHFQHNRGTITLDGFNQLLFGSATFYNLTKTTQIAQSLDIQSNSTFVIDNTLKLKGTIQQPLTVQTTKSDPAFLEPKGPTDLSYLHVNNLINLSPNTVACTTCTKDNATSGWNIATEADSKAITDRIAELFSNPEELLPTPALIDEGTVAGDTTPPSHKATAGKEKLTLTDKDTADFASNEDITFTLELTDTEIDLQPAIITTETGDAVDLGENELPTTDEELTQAELAETPQDVPTVEPEELDVTDPPSPEATAGEADVPTDVITDVQQPAEKTSQTDSTEPITTTEPPENSNQNPQEISLLEYFIPAADAQESGSWGPGDPSTSSGQAAQGKPIITTTILDFRDEPTDITPTVTEVDGETIIHVDAPTTTFRPGKYTLRVEATIDGRTITQRQDFTWGVLAMNSSKSTYTPGDTMDIGMAVLDDEGHTLCNADLILTITDPAGTTETKTTEPYVEPTDTDEDGDPIIPEQPEADIARSSECGPRTVTNTPDYTTELRDTIEGTYQLHLTATTENGTRILERDVLVTDTEPFTVTRNTATRIWPGADYEVQLHITATQPFIGDITESVPSVFEITAISSNGEINSPDTTIADPTDDPEEPTELETLEDLLNGAPINASDSPTQLTWTNQAISPDQPLTLTYTYNPPDISPQFYLAGPLELQATDASAVGGPSEEILVEATDTAVNGEAGSTNQEDEITTENSTTADTPENSPEPSPEAEVEVSPSPEATISPSPEVLGDTDESEVFPTPAASISPSPDVITDVITSPSPSSTPSPTAEPTVTPTPTTTPETSPNPSSSPQPSPTALVDEPEPAVAITTVISSWIEPRQWQIASDATISISGSCKQSDQSTDCTDESETFRVGVAGSLAAQTDATVDGSYTISSVTVNTGDVVTVFIDGAADADEAVAVTKYDGSGNITGLDLFEGHLNIGSDDNQTITNEDLADYDNSVSSDEDIFHDVTMPTAHWKMDEGTGTNVADSIGSNDGTLTGASWDNDSADLAPLNFTNSYSLDFDGIDDDVSVSDDNVLDLTTDFTVGFWIKTANGGGVDSFPLPLAKEPVNSAWLFGIDSTDEPYFRCDDGSNETAFDDDTINDGTWEHWAGSKVGDNIIFYRDGRAVDFEETSGDCHTTTGDLVFGGGSGGNSFEGHMDDIRIYGTALNHPDIAALAAGDTGNTLTVDSEDARDEELYVKSGNTFDPLGNVYVHDIEIDGTWAESASLVEVTGSWDNDATFTKDAGRVVFAGNTDETIDATGATTDDFNDVYFNDGLIAHWKFDDNTGFTATDSSGYGRDAGLQDEGTVSGPTWDASVKASLNRINTSALEFDGTDEYVNVGPIDATVKTMAMWVNLDDNTADYLANMTDAGGSYWEVTGGTELNVLGWTSPTRYVDGATSPLTISANTWTHLAATDTTAQDFDLFLIGFREGASSNTLDGHVDDVRLYDRVLTAGDISDLANGDYLATEDTGSSEYSLSSDLDVDGDLHILSGDLSPGSNDITLAGDWHGGDGIFTDGTSTVTFDGEDKTQNINGTTEFYNFTANEDTNNAIMHIMEFEEGVTFTIANTLTMQGLDTNDQVLLRSSDGSTQFTLNITGEAQCVDTVDVSDSNVTGSYDIYAENSDNTDNNDTGGSPHWIFGNCPITIAGSVYTDEGVSKISGSKTVRLYINGTSYATTAETSSGDFSMLVTDTVSANDILTLFIEDETEDGVTVTGATGNDQTGVDIYENYLITRHDNGGSLTNANLDTADGAGSDADITNIYTVDASDNVTVPDGVELYVESGDTYAPGANIIADDIDINGTLTMAANDAEVHGSWDATGGSFSQTGQTMFTSTADETITSNSGSFGDLIINDGLVGYWKFDDGSGTNAVDSSGYGNDGTLTLGPTWDNDAGDVPPTLFKNDYSIEFDGSDDEVDVGSSDELDMGTGDVSVAAWIKADSAEASAYNIIFSNGANTGTEDGVWFGTAGSTDGDGVIQVWVSNGTSYVVNQFEGTTDLTDDQWHHVVWAWDRNVGNYAYVDGAQDNTDASTNSDSITSDHNHNIGGHDSGSNNFDGHIDDVRVYNRLLSVDEISALAAGNQPATEDTAASEFSLSGTLDVNGDLILNSGELDADAAITVAGAWHNNGGKFNESTQTVTLDDSTGTNEIQSGGQAFYNLTSAPTGATTYELHDDLTVTNVLSLADSDSAFDGNTYTLWVDDFEQSNGDFTGDNSTVVITSSDNETVSFGTGDDAYHNVHTEDPQENGLVGYWKFDEGQGTTTVDSSSNSNDGTLTNGPLWKNHAHDGLVGYWKFDENTGTSTYDASGYDQTGTLTARSAGTPSWESTTLAPLDETNTSGLDFDGTDDYVDLGDDVLSGNSAVTVTAWVRPDAIAEDGGVYNAWDDGVSTNSSLLLWADDSTTDRWQCIVRDSAHTSVQTGSSDEAPVTTGVWQHVACRFIQNDAVEIFLNGVEKDSDAVANLALDTTSGVKNTIGGNNTSTSRDFDGNIDDVRIYNRALSDGEIANVALGKPLDESTITDFQNPSYIELDGGNDHITVADDDSLSFGDASTDDPFSISAWFNIDDATRFRAIAKGAASLPEYTFHANASDDLVFSLYDGNSSNYIQTVSDTALTSDEGSWIHVVATYNGNGSDSDLDIYKNGSLEASTDATTGSYTAMHNQTSGAVFGRNFVDGANFADGSIDDVRIYDYALSTDEIANLYNGSYASNTPDEDLVGYWKFDDGSGSTAKDTSKNNNDGTLYNMEAGDWDASVKATLDVTNSHALHFDGSNEYVNAGNTDLTSAKTVSFWLNADDDTSRGVITIDGTDAIEINASDDIAATNFPAATVYVDGSSASADVNANNWHHVAITDTTGVNARGLILGRATTDGFDVSTASYDSAYDTTSQNTDPRGIAFNTDGTKMFIVGVTTSEVNEYTLSTGFDVSTASFVDAFDTSSEIGSGRGIAFNTDGTKMFIVDSHTSDEVHEYTLSSAFDVSSASFVDALDVSSEDTFPTGLAFSNDGTKMFVIGLTGDDVNEYTLSTGFDVSTASFVDATDISTNVTAGQGLAFNHDGTKMFITDNTGQDVSEFTLSTGFDASTASYVDAFDVSTQTNDPHGIAFNTDGTKMLIMDETDDEVLEYDVGTITYFDGHLDDVRIYDRVLSTGEIEQLNAGGTIDAVITLDTTLDVNNDLHLHSGALDANSSENNNQTVAGDFNNSDLFIPRTSTTTLDGTDQRVTGSTSFYSLTKEETSDDATDTTLTFESSKLFTILNTLTFRGTDDSDRLNLDATTSGTKAIMNPTSGDQTTSWLDLTDTESSTYDIVASRSDDTSNTDSGEVSPHWIIRARSAIHQFFEED